MLFYFTGTGNSLYTAQRIAQATGDTLISMVDAEKKDEFIYDAEERVGFVFPVYYYGLPSTVADFLSRLKLRGADKSYVFSVVTCGSITGAVGAMFEKAPAFCGLTVSASFSLRMVDNYVPVLSLPSKDGVAEMLAMADEDLDVIIQKIVSRDAGDFDELKGVLPALRTRLAYPKYANVRHTKNFRVSDSCIGCGLCAKHCNSEAIEIRDKHPVWVKDSCNLCLACLHRCPKSAIEFGKMTANHGRYINPKAKWQSEKKV
ncbi:MAG: EFR1 family ferrodoxin [Methanocorpusculum sp.]|nr:EFR1 family ferrodoxin [Methanocorpusculum sp.]